MDLEIIDFMGLVITGAIYLIVLGIVNLKKPKED